MKTTIGILMSLAALAACGISDDSPEAFPVAGVRSGDFLYPDFQRWRIVHVAPLPDAKIPRDAGGIPTILLGRSIYIGRGYMTVPFLNADGEVMSPACFRPTDAGLEAQLVTGNATEYGQAMMLRALDQGRLSVVLFQVFEATLAREDVRPGEEPGRDSLDRSFNERLKQEQDLAAAAPCELAAVELPALENGPLELLAPGTGRRFVVRDADLDLRTPRDGYTMSQEWRRRLDPSLPENYVSGCRGEVQITRLMWGEVGRLPSRYEYRLFSSLYGEDDERRLCARLRFLRRIDTEYLMHVLMLPPIEYRGAVLARQTPFMLLRWVEDGLFRARLGPHEIEVTVYDEPRLDVRLIGAPLPGARPAVAGQAQVPAYDPELDTKYEQDPGPGPDEEIHRWVDENGVVHYSDQPGPQ